VLTALREAASRLREPLGESLASVQNFDAPLEEATTSSLEALKAFSLARNGRSCPRGDSTDRRGADRSARRSSTFRKRKQKR
jgi:hypothetical protein